MRRPFFILIALSLIMIACACTNSDSDAAPTKELQIQISEGVALIGCAGDKAIRIENRNTYAVRIQQVWQYDGGEQTKAVDLLEPGAKLEVGNIRCNDGFCIYTLDGALVGFLSGRCP
jgi:hypothetical protein